MVAGVAATAAMSARAQARTHEPILVQPSPRPAGAQPNRRPNILWIQTDEQRPDSLGCYGSRWARTPHIDRLAREGSVFTECHVQAPTCVPSRTSMLACRYPQELGIYNNLYYYEDGVLARDLTTFPKLLADAGYRTASFGKWHTPNVPTWHEIDPFQTFDTIDPTNVRDPEQERLGRIIRRPRGAPIIIGGLYPEDERWGIDMGAHLTDRAIDWLRAAAAGDQPFFLRVSHIWPHTPAVVPRPWQHIYEPHEVKVPIDHREEMYANRSLLDKRLSDEQGGNELDRETWEWVCQTYYACCAYVDHQVGRLMFELEKLGLADNTIIAFNSDHGRNNGEYGCCEKMTYDREVWRVPFIFRWPGRVPAGEVRNDLCELLDFGPTLLSLAGVLPNEDMRGRDLFSSEEPDAVYGVLERGGNHDLDAPHDDDNRGHRRLAIRTRRWRYDFASHLKGQELPADQQHPSLYDIEHDPEERFNLIDDPKHADTVRDLHAKLQGWFDSIPIRRA